MCVMHTITTHVPTLGTHHKKKILAFAATTMLHVHG
jgi:hypothetical protein